MYPAIHLRFFDLLEFHIPTYMLFASVGLFVMMLYLYMRINKLQVDFRQFLCMMAFMVLGVGAGSKLLFIITKIPDIVSDFSWKNVFEIIWRAGFVFYGGLFGCILGLKLFCIIFRKSFYDVSQIVTPAFPLFHTFGRIGCFFAGCCYGRVSNWGIPMSFEPNVRRIPVQLIESVFLLFLFHFLFIMWKRNVKCSLLVVYLVAYSVFRFIIEFYRGDELRGIFGGLSTSQWVAVIVVVVVTIVKIKTMLHKKNGAIQQEVILNMRNHETL